jgi:hypothetical protein
MYNNIFSSTQPSTIPIQNKYLTQYQYALILSLKTTCVYNILLLLVPFYYYLFFTSGVVLQQMYFIFLLL